MNKVLNILVEGPTEKEFVTNLIYPYLQSKEINNVRVITIETSPGFKGGDVRYFGRYKPNILKLLNGKEDSVVTSLIDFYRLRSDFPGYKESGHLLVEQRITHIENACANDIGNRKFIPYIQLHEFEGLLFSDTKGFDLFPNLPSKNKKELTQIVQNNPNPELINDGVHTAPSKRLLRLIPGYQKPLYGNMIALENGFDAILLKCPRFNAWMKLIVERMQA